MANNSISYNRFTALPANIANFGQTAEEISLQRGTPETDTRIAPMAAPAEPAQKLALDRLGSDRFRLAGPGRPVENPFEGPKSNLVHSRNAVKKLRSAVVDRLSEVVGAEDVATPALRAQMNHSLERVRGLAEFLDYQNQLTDRIYAIALGSTRG